MRSLKDKYLGTMPLQEADYKVDFNILEKYQAFSSELLRLALLGLAVFGFLVTNVVMKVDKANAKTVFCCFEEYKCIFMIAAITLVLSAACSMAHRYFSTDSLTHFVRKLRLLKKVDDLNAADTEPKDLAGIAHFSRLITIEKASLDSDLSLSGRLLIGSAGFLLVGIICIMSGFVLTMAKLLPLIQ